MRTTGKSEITWIQKRKYHEIGKHCWAGIITATAAIVNLISIDQITVSHAMFLDRT